MFTQNKYLKIYYRIINNALQQQRNNDSGSIYYESHHIIPKCMGGTDDSFNRVLLTAKEHYICHRLLPKFTIGKFKYKLSYALWAMINRSNKFQKRTQVTARSYEYIRKEYITQQSKGRKGKTLVELYGNEKAQTILLNMKSRKSRGSPSIKEREEISKRIKNLSKTKPWKRNFQIKPLDRKICPHCLREFDLGNYGRYHGDKCKSRQSSIKMELEI